MGKLFLSACTVVEHGLDQHDELVGELVVLIR